MKEEDKEFKIDSRSSELINKWRHHANLIKTQHPEWDEEKIREEMKNLVFQDAKAAFSTKSSKEYIEEMNAHLKKIEEARNRAIDGIMTYMGKTSPDAVATVMFELDCGCIRACAVSREGKPMGEMIMISGKQVEENYECNICRNDGGADPARCIGKSIVWPGDESALPSEEFRLAIGREVFGEEYTLDDI